MPADLLKKVVIYIIVILSVGGLTWLFLASRRAPLPQYPVISNITPSSANVSWYTLSPTPGCVMAYIPKAFVWPWEIKFACDSLIGKNNHLISLSRLKSGVLYKVFAVNKLTRFEVSSFRTREDAAPEIAALAAGKITSATGSPVAAATVVATFGSRAFSSQTDANGQFSLKVFTQTPPDPLARVYIVVNTYPYQTFSGSFSFDSINPVPDIILAK